MSPDILHGRVVVITGASSGIGEACAMACGHAGMSVVAVARRTDRLDALAERLMHSGARALSFTADVTDAHQMKAAVAAAIDAFGRLDAIVCNAGIGYYGPLEDTPPSALERLIDVNLMGSFHAAMAALPVFRAAGTGHLVFVSSIVGRRAVPGSGAYAASKFAQTGLAEALRAELLGTGVEVSTVFPVSTATGFREAAEREFGYGGKGLGPRQSADQVARTIVALLARPRPEAYPLRGAWLVPLLSLLAPRLGDRLVTRFERRRETPVVGTEGRR